jgi:hypothetical protein
MSSEEAELVSKRLKIRNHLKGEYQKLVNNPFRVSNSVIDPAVLRYEAARHFAPEYYKPTSRSVLLPVIFVSCVVLGQIWFNRSQAEKERVIRSGESTYYDRSRGLTRFTN